MAFTPKEIIVGATVPLANGSSVTLSFAGHIEREQDCDDAVLIFSRKLLKYTNSASDEDRLTARQVVSSITSTPLDKVPDVGTPAPIPPPVTPAKTPASVTLDQVSPLPERMPTPTAAEQAAAAVQRVIKPPEAAPELAPSAPLATEASAPAGAPTAPQAAKPAPVDGGACERCGAPVTKSQAKLSRLFMSKTLCKKCMEAP